MKFTVKLTIIAVLSSCGSSSNNNPIIPDFSESEEDTNDENNGFNDGLWGPTLTHKYQFYWHVQHYRDEKTGKWVYVPIDKFPSMLEKKKTVDACKSGESFQFDECWSSIHIDLDSGINSLSAKGQTLKINLFERIPDDFKAKYPRPRLTKTLNVPASEEMYQCTTDLACHLEVFNKIDIESHPDNKRFGMLDKVLILTSTHFGDLREHVLSPKSVDVHFWKNKGYISFKGEKIVFSDTCEEFRKQFLGWTQQYEKFKIDYIGDRRFQINDKFAIDCRESQSYSPEKNFMLGIEISAIDYYY